MRAGDVSHGHCQHDSSGASGVDAAGADHND